MDILIYTARQTTEEDYTTLSGWWESYGFPTPSIDFLPDNGKCGLMVVDNNGVEYCAGFIYETNSAVCWMELIVANPDIKDKGTRKETLNYLITQLSDMVGLWGYKWIFTSLEHPSLKQRYLDCGFTIGATETTELIKQL